MPAAVPRPGGPMLERLFHLSDHGTTAATELRAGVVTFLTVSYILFVNPQILSQAGLPAGDVVFATAISSAVATLIMGLWARYPFALAPGMGLNAFFTFGVVLGLGVDWRSALAAVFVAGVLFLVLSAGGLRRRVLEAIPTPIKIATTSGIGLFLALIGLEAAGLVVDDPETLITLGDPTTPGALVALGALMLVAALERRGTKGAILWGILAATGASWLLGITPPPEGFVTLPSLPEATLGALDFRGLLTGPMIPVVLAFLFVDLFDTAGTLIGVGRLGGFVDTSGNLPRSGRAFAADALGTTVGAALGTSPVTSYIESATGIEEGGRTGLTAVVVACLFLLAPFFTPLLATVPAVATAPALIVVGALMLRGAGEIAWQRIDEAVPAFLTLTIMPFTYSIAHGIASGIISWVAIKVLSGRLREISPAMALLAVLLVLYYSLVRL